MYTMTDMKLNNNYFFFLHFHFIAIINMSIQQTNYKSKAIIQFQIYIFHPIQICQLMKKKFRVKHMPT